jgi:glycerol-3-phosphate dehydrogenase (NAD(P)+)
MSELAELKKKIPTQVAVLGGGSWATALVKILSENNVKIKWWIRPQIQSQSKLFDGRGH